MELDDLKQSWKITPVKIKNTDIMELIQHKSYGPIATLKKEFRKQIVLMCLMPVLLILTNLNNIEHTLTSILFWAYVLFCMAIVISSFFSYNIVKKMSENNGNVKSNLEQQINVLEKRLSWKIKGVRIVTVFFIILLEIVPSFQHYSMLDKWHSLPFLIRFGSYTLLLVLQYFASRKVCDRKFGSHLRYLRGLVSEMETK